MHFQDYLNSMHSTLSFPFWRWELLAELTMNRKTFFSGAEVRVYVFSLCCKRTPKLASFVKGLQAKSAKLNTS